MYGKIICNNVNKIHSKKEKKCFIEKQHSLQYVDLDEFLSENGITTGEGMPANGGPRLPPQGPEIMGHDPPMQLTLTKRERSPSPSPCEPLSPATLNPCSPADSSKFIIKINETQCCQSLSKNIFFFFFKIGT